MRISDWSSDVCSSDLRAALAKLAEAAERQAITIGDLAMAIFRASGERPPVGAIGGPGADREKILGQRPVAAEEAARCYGMVDIDHIFGADGADRAIAVDRDVDRPVLPPLHRPRQAIGGKAARKSGREPGREGVGQYV